MNAISLHACKISFLLSASLAVIWVEKDNFINFFVVLFVLFVAVNEVLSYLTDRPMYLISSQIPGESKLSMERIVSFVLHSAVIFITIYFC